MADNSNININMNVTNQIKAAQQQRQIAKQNNNTQSVDSKLKPTVDNKPIFQTSKFIQELSKSKIFQNISNSLLKLVQNSENTTQKYDKTLSDLQKSLSNLEKIFTQNNPDFKTIPQLFSKNSFFKDIYDKVDTIDLYFKRKAIEEKNESSTLTSETNNNSIDLTQTNTILTTIDTSIKQFADKLDSISKNTQNINLDNLITKEDISTILSDIKVNIQVKNVDEITSALKQNNNEILQSVNNNILKIQQSLQSYLSKNEMLENINSTLDTLNTNITNFTNNKTQQSSLIPQNLQNIQSNINTPIQVKLTNNIQQTNTQEKETSIFDLSDDSIDKLKDIINENTDIQSEVFTSIEVNNNQQKNENQNTQTQPVQAQTVQIQSPIEQTVSKENVTNNSTNTNLQSQNNNTLDITKQVIPNNEIEIGIYPDISIMNQKVKTEKNNELQNINQNSIFEENILQLLPQIQDMFNISQQQTLLSSRSENNIGSMTQVINSQPGLQQNNNIANINSRNNRINSYTIKSSYVIACIKYW